MDKMRGIATLDNTVIMLIETKQFKKCHDYQNW